jgi:osmoprotectant transport system ATP-binding protein
MNIAELINVSHSYQGQSAIKNISLGFQENKTTAIIGKSGSGKSTLLQFFNGLIRPASGSVNIFGEALNYSQINSLRLRMGYMVQGTGLFPHLSIKQNISIAGKITNTTTNSAQRVDELMSLVGLPSSYKKRFPYELSGGEQQRVGICRALFLNPSILLMDEPLSALDPITRQEIQTEILKLQQLQPRTILLVTHDMREAKKLADYILVIDKGEVQQYDTAEKVLQHPANVVVEKLIEASLL